MPRGINLSRQLGQPIAQPENGRASPACSMVEPSQGLGQAPFWGIDLSPSQLVWIVRVTFGP